jgi:hypothetical protein
VVKGAAMTPPQDLSGPSVIVIGDAFELIALVDGSKALWTELDPALRVIDDTFVGIAALAKSANPAALGAFLRKQRGELVAGFGPHQPHVDALDGGPALFADGVDPILPQCCGDMRDLLQWNYLAAWEHSWWQEFHMGHPNLLVRRADDTIWISPEHEAGSERVPQGVIYVLDSAALTARVDALTASLEALVPQVEVALIGVVRDPAHRVAAARALIGLDYDTAGWWDEGKQ